jgi:hypothetical protein
MNCVEFGFDRSRGFGSGRGQFWPIAIDRPTRPYNIASTTVQQVMDPTSRGDVTNWNHVRSKRDKPKKRSSTHTRNTLAFTQLVTN